MAKQEKTEKATPKRKEDARKKEGTVAKSNDLVAAVLLLVSFVFLRIWMPHLVSQFEKLIKGHIADSSETAMSVEGIMGAFGSGMIQVMFLLVPFMAVAVVTAIIINVSQVKFVFVSSAVKPKGNRLDPISGFKRMFSGRAIFDLFKNLGKVSVVALVAYLSVSGGINTVLGMSGASTEALIAVLAAMIFDLCWKVTLLLLVLGVIDYGYQKYSYEKKLKMTKHEVKEEFKQTEGDPLIKSAIKQRMIQMARHRMMQMVPQATAVVTNPTSIAVALQYDSSMRAPKVVAKGKNFVAKRIKEIASENGIPIVEDKPLARTLYKNVEIDQEISPDLYKAVAEIIAYVYRLKKGGRTRAS